ncbi:unnamed protein product [Moneuplotes crassus]|uniref:Uncharacterized protein n=1 Tax=Euplotes crassus TaxID=5936 RepID=A0AAD1UL48_EUPCR|nr:unnamed protein product [Moneuplotes crassus]
MCNKWISKDQLDYYNLDEIVSAFPDPFCSREDQVYSWYKRRIFIFTEIANAKRNTAIWFLLLSNSDAIIEASEHVDCVDPFCDYKRPTTHHLPGFMTKPLSYIFTTTKICHT